MGRIFTCIVVVAISLFCAPSVVAQGTMGMLPEPMNTNELRGYADRLNLSDQQRQALHSLHDQYKQDFRNLRQGEIAEFLKRMRDMSGNAMPQRQAVESFLKDMDQLNGKIASLDNRMFDQMQPILTEEQLGHLPRVKMARQRTRYLGNQMMWMTGSRSPDLSELLKEIEVPDDAMQNIDGTMANYEARLTSAMGKLYETSTKTILAMYDAMEAAGFNEDSMTDPEAAEKMGEVMQNVWKDAMVKPLEAAKDVADLNLRTYKSLVPLLPDDSWRSLRNQFYRRAYPVMSGLTTNASDYFSVALKLDSLTADQRGQLSAAQTDVNAKVDRLLDDAAALAATSGSGMNPWDFDQEAMQEMHKKIAEYQQQMMEISQKAMTQVTEIVGAENASKIAAQVGSFNAKAMEAAQAEAMAGAAAMAGDDVVIEDEDGSIEGQTEQFAGYFDQFLPQPISAGDVTEFAQMLQLTPEQKTVMQQLHSTYKEGFKKVSENEIAAFTKAQQNMWRYDEATETTAGPTEASIEDTHRLRQAAIGAITAVDKSFFEDVAIAVIDDDKQPLLERVKMLRQRNNYNKSNDMWGSWGGNSAEWRMDLSTLVLKDRSLAAEQKQQLDAILIEYEKQATDLMKKRFDASLGLHKAQEMWQVHWQENSENPMKASQDFQKIVGDASKRNNEATQALRDLNRQTFSKIIAALPAQEGNRLRMDYNRKAYPEVYNDELGMDSRLTEALNLNDLTAEQRRRISDLAAEYRPAYAALSEKMVAITAETDTPNMMSMEDPDAWKKWQEKREQMGSMRFDRDELSQRVILDLKNVLTAEQLKRIGGMPEPRERHPYESW